MWRRIYCTWDECRRWLYNVHRNIRKFSRKYRVCESFTLWFRNRIIDFFCMKDQFIEHWFLYLPDFCAKSKTCRRYQFCSPLSTSKLNIFRILILFWIWEINLNHWENAFFIFSQFLSHLNTFWYLKYLLKSLEKRSFHIFSIFVTSEI